MIKKWIGVQHQVVKSYQLSIACSLSTVVGECLQHGGVRAIKNTKVTLIKAVESVFLQSVSRSHKPCRSVFRGSLMGMGV